MSKNDKLSELVQRASEKSIEDYRIARKTVNVYKDVVEVLRQVTAEKATNGEEYFFSPKVLHEIFEVNDTKYFADLLWRQSTIEKNLIANPKHDVVFVNVARSVYRLATDEEIEAAKKLKDELKKK